MRLIQIEYVTIRIPADLFGDLCDLLAQCQLVEIRHSADYSVRGIDKIRPLKFESFVLPMWEEPKEAEETSNEA